MRSLPGLEFVVELSAASKIEIEIRYVVKQHI